MTSTANIDRQLIIEELFAGRVIGITAREATVQLDNADESFGIQYNGYTYGAGEVGELLVFEGRSNLVVGQITSVHEEVCDNPREIRRIAKVSLLATACLNTGNLKIGVSNFPRIGARAFCVPIGYLKDLHEHTKDENLGEGKNNDETSETNQQDAEVKKATVPSEYARLGTLQNFNNIPFKISLTKLMERHCGIFGATGGGKTFTAAKLIEAVSKPGGRKIVIIDPTGEYENVFTGKESKSDANNWKIEIFSSEIKRKQMEDANGSGTTDEGNVNFKMKQVFIPYNMLTIEAVSFLFDPNGEQKHYLNEAIISLRFQSAKCNKCGEGETEKCIHPLQRTSIDSRSDEKLDRDQYNSKEFNLDILPKQIEEECFSVIDQSTQLVHHKDPIAIRICRNLITKIKTFIELNEDPNSLFKHSKELDKDNDFQTKLNNFLESKNTDNFFYINLKNVPKLFRINQLVIHLIGNYLYDQNSLKESDSILLFLDEAHNFISPDSKEISKEFNAFERIAREGRKIGLNLCLVTQCPQDLPEVVLNQLGTVIVHRLSGDHDRKLMERSCGDIDVSALSSLPILGTGQAVVLGTNFPIPVVVNVDAPINKPGFIG